MSGPAIDLNVDRRSFFFAWIMRKRHVERVEHRLDPIVGGTW